MVRVKTMLVLVWFFLSSELVRGERDLMGLVLVLLQVEAELE